MIIPARVQLPARYAGQPLGYRVLNLNLSLFSAFTSVNVAEIHPSFYVVSEGVNAPDAGGYLIWGVKGQDLMTATIQPSVVKPILSGVIDELNKLARRIIEAMPKPAAQQIAVKTEAFEAGVAALRAELAEMLRVDGQADADRLDVVTQRVDELYAELQRIDAPGAVEKHVETTAQGLADLAKAARRLDEMSGIAVRLLSANAGIDQLGAVVGKLEAFYTEVRRMNTEAWRAEEMRQESLAALEEFLDKVQ